MNTPRIVSLTAALILMLTTAVELLPQDSPPVVKGDRVRVSRLGNVPPVICTVLALKADTLVLDAEDRVETLAVPLALVGKLEVSRGEKSNAGGGALTGGLVGGTVGAIIGLGMWRTSGSDDFISFGPEAVAIGAGVGGGVGLLLGALIGAASTSDLWEEVPLEEIRVALPSVNAKVIELSVTLRL